MDVASRAFDSYVAQRMPSRHRSSRRLRAPHLEPSADLTVPYTWASGDRARPPSSMPSPPTGRIPLTSGMQRHHGPQLRHCDPWSRADAPTAPDSTVASPGHGAPGAPQSSNRTGTLRGVHFKTYATAGGGNVIADTDTR